jgi:flagellar protein FlaG
MRIDTPAHTAIAAHAPVQVTAPAPVPATGTPAATAATQASTYNPAADIQNAVANINRYLRDMDRSAQFRIDEATGKTVVQVVDSATKEIIRQMPSEEALAIARAMSRSSGMLLNEHA